MIRGHIYCNKCDMWYKPLEKIIRTITNNEGIKINVGYMVMVCPVCGHTIRMEATERAIQEFEVN